MTHKQEERFMRYAQVALAIKLGYMIFPSIDKVRLTPHQREIRDKLMFGAPAKVVRPRGTGGKVDKEIRS